MPHVRVARKFEEGAGDGHEEAELVGATLQVVDDSCWTRDLAVSGVSVQILSSTPLSSETMREALVASGTAEACESLLAHLRRTPTVADFSLTWTGRNRLFGVVDSRGCSACRILQGSGAVALDRACFGTAPVRWNLICRGRPTLEALIAELQGRGLKVMLERIGPAPDAGGITPRQREVLQVAMELGYFNAPREVGLADIAEHFGVSKTAVSRILRKAERNGLSSFGP